MIQISENQRSIHAHSVPGSGIRYLPEEPPMVILQLDAIPGIYPKATFGVLFFRWMGRKDQFYVQYSSALVNAAELPVFRPVNSRMNVI